ncbi:hypothetical protein Tco_0413049 [Tanacetum coccineum]
MQTSTAVCGALASPISSRYTPPSQDDFSGDQRGIIWCSARTSLLRNPLIVSTDLSFDPLGKVIHGHYQEFDFPRPFQERTSDVNSPLVKWPRGRDRGQWLLRFPWYGTMYLAVLALAYRLPPISVHGWPIISERMALAKTEPAPAWQAADPSCISRITYPA